MREIKLTVLVALVLSTICSFLVAYGQDVVPRIINGVATDEFESVGIVGSTEYPEGFGSGTLITPQHVLTAAHVADFINGQTIGVFIVNGDVYFTSQIFIHRDYNDLTLDNDIAILELSEPVAGVTPSQINLSTPVVNDRLIIVGYGAGGDETGADDTFGTKMVGETSIDYVGETFIAWNFDAGESNTAPGDSGGPAYLEIEGELFIAGITSSGTDVDAAVGDYSVDTRVDAYTDWIDAVIEGDSDGDEGDEGDGTDSPDWADECPPHRPGNHRPGNRRPGTHHSVGHSPNHDGPGNHRSPGFGAAGFRPSGFGQGNVKPGIALHPGRRPSSTDASKSMSRSGSSTSGVLSSDNRRPTTSRRAITSSPRAGSFQSLQGKTPAETTVRRVGSRR